MQRPEDFHTADGSALSPGTVFSGKYRISHCIGVGGMGSVYEVEHHQTRGRYALKVMAARLVHHPEARQRFLQEAQVTATIESDHIVRVFDAGIDGATGMPFIAMELLRGEDLDAMLQRQGPLPPVTVVALLHQAALALDKTHAAGVVHRDLKPHNLFITQRDDGTPCVKILDFGIAKLVDATGSAQRTRSAGTPMYMPPEQIRGDGDIGASADIYAVAHIAFTMLTGKPYWEKEAVELGLSPFIAQVLAGPPELASARAARAGVRLPPTFDAWFARAAPVSRDRLVPATRSIEELANVFGLSLSSVAYASLPVGAPPPQPPGAPALQTTAASLPPSREQPKSSGGRWWMLAALLVILLGGGGAVAWQLGNADSGEVAQSSKKKKSKDSQSGNKKKKKKKKGNKKDAAKPEVEASARPSAEVKPSSMPCQLERCTDHELDRAQPIEALDHVEAAGQLARSMDPKATLVAIHLKGLVDGHFPPGKKMSLVYMYRVAKAAKITDEVDGIVVVATSKQLNARKQKVPGVGDVTSPKCNTRSALKAAIDAGMDPKPDATLGLMNLLGTTEWLVSYPGSTHKFHVNGDTCSVYKKPRRKKR